MGPAGENGFFSVEREGKFYAIRAGGRIALWLYVLLAIVSAPTDPGQSGRLNDVHFFIHGSS